MKANELLARLRHVTLCGYEDGQLIWCGTDSQWRASEMEEMAIMKEHEMFPREVKILPPVDYEKLSNLIK